MVALSVILFPPLLIAFLLVMERVEEPLRRPASPREVIGVPRHGDRRRGRHPRRVRHPPRAVPLARPPRRARQDGEPAARLTKDLPAPTARGGPLQGGRSRPVGQPPPTDRVTDGTAA